MAPTSGQGGMTQELRNFSNEVKSLPKDKDTILGACGTLAQHAKSQGISPSDWRETFENPDKYVSGEGGSR